MCWWLAIGRRAHRISVDKTSGSVKRRRAPCRVVLVSDFQADSTLTHLTIQVTQIWLNSTLYFSWLTQLRLNSNHEFFNLTQLWLNSFESELSQIWLTLITFYLIWPKVVDRGGGGVRPNVVVGWFFPCKTTDKCKILTFLFRKISALTFTQAVSSWLNSDSNDDQRDSTLTRLISFIFTADSTLTRLIWVRVESNLTHDSWVEHNPGTWCSAGARKLVRKWTITGEDSEL